MKRYYAGIGARDTPPEVLEMMTTIASVLSKRNWSLRSGGAIGADSAFEEGANIHAEIFKPSDASQAAEIMAGKYHPNWAACKPYVRKLHGRNCQILLGRYLNSPVEFIICWTKDGAVIGGTGQALRMAIDLNIPVINFAIVPTVDRVLNVIESIIV